MKEFLLGFLDGVVIVNTVLIIKILKFLETLIEG